MFRDRVLKIQPVSPEAQREVQMLSWLRGKLPVPQVLLHEIQEDASFLLMSRLPGEMACAERYMEDPAALMQLLAQGLGLLWQVDISNCPSMQKLDQKLLAARQRVEQGLVDMEDTQPGTYGPGGFRDPQALLRWLEENRPEEEPVLSHGDYCLPNVFFQDGAVSGFLDLGRCGISDKWMDIALCHRSLQNNFSGFYGKAYPGFREEGLFEALNLPKDEDKLRYYILLDELF